MKSFENIQSLKLCMQEKNLKWMTIVSEIYAIRQQLERINTGEIIERPCFKCMKVRITLKYEDLLQALINRNPKLNQIRPKIVGPYS